MNPAQKQKVQQAIALLSSLVLGEGASSDISSVNLPSFNGHIQKAVDYSKNAQPQIKNLTQLFIQAIDLMNSIIAHSGKAKKFSNDVQQSLKGRFMDIGRRVQEVDKNPDFRAHSKALSQLVGTTFWVFASAPDFIFKGGIQAADFNALKFKKNKNADHNAWYNEILEVIKCLHIYVKQNFVTGLTFNFNGTQDWSSVAKGIATVQHHQQSKKEVVPQTKQAKKKEPSKVFAGINWTIANYESGQVVLKQGEVKMMQGIFVENCQNCVIKVQGKFKSILINKCSNIGLIAKACVSGIEVMNCQNIRVQILEKSPSVSVDKSKKVTLILNGEFKECDIVSSKAQELNICYTKGNQLSKDFPVCQQLITKWNPQMEKFETRIYDTFM